jgi:hypothetical protein
MEPRKVWQQRDRQCRRAARCTRRRHRKGARVRPFRQLRSVCKLAAGCDAAKSELAGFIQERQRCIRKANGPLTPYDPVIWGAEEAWTTPQGAAHSQCVQEYTGVRGGRAAVRGCPGARAAHAAALHRPLPVSDRSCAVHRQSYIICSRVGSVHNCPQDGKVKVLTGRRVHCWGLAASASCKATVVAVQS